MKETFLASLSGTARYALIVLAGLTLVATCTPANAQLQFGSRCQATFQNGWLPDINVNPICNDFDAQIPVGEFNTVEFYYNLHGAVNSFQYGNSEETSKSWGGPDSVDFFVMSTHGGIANNNADVAGYAMWDESCPGTIYPGCTAWTDTMRFGSSGRQLKALATFSCDTLKSADRLLPKRWGSAFAGGLKMLAGGSELLYDSDTDTIGYDFALLMQDGNSIGTSWLNAVYNNDNDNNPGIANTGSNANSCWNRQNVLMSQLLSESVLRDKQIGYYCWTWWGQP
jgi:Family of unknown function (DUF6345)